MTVAATKIVDIAEISAGYPFRGAVPSDANGSVLVVQMRDLHIAGVNWASAARVALSDVRDDYRLRSGDLLFVPRGESFHATVVEAVPAGVLAVCGPHLFRVRITSPEFIQPAFLAWWLNQPPGQADLDQEARGSAQRMLRKADLLNLWIPLPSLADQAVVAALQAAADRERAVLAQLIELRAAEMAGLAQHYHRKAEWPLT